MVNFREGNHDSITAKTTARVLFVDPGNRPQKDSGNFNWGKVNALTTTRRLKNN